MQKLPLRQSWSSDILVYIIPKPRISMTMDPAQYSPLLTDLSQELLCQIIKHLTVRETISLTLLCRKLRDAVELHLRTCKVLDFGSRNVVTYLPCNLTDESLHAFLNRCPQVEYIYGFNPRLLEQRRLRRRGSLTVRGIICAFSSCKTLKGVNTACVRLMEAILDRLPKVRILGHFSNKINDEQTPLSLKRISLPSNPRVGSLTLTGVDIPELTVMPEVEYLALQFVRFTKQNPFKNFSAPNLKTCILSHITGPSVASRYQTFFMALGEAEDLSHLELTHVPLLSGTIRSATAEHRRLGGRGFRKLKTLCISNCTELHDMDIGSLSIMSMFNLESLSMQATFTKNTFFAALHVACSALDSSYAKVHTLRLGYMGNAGYGGPIGRHPLEVEGSRYAENAYLQALVSDAGIQNAVKLFPAVRSLYVGNSPHVRNPCMWKEEGKPNWRGITDLTLKRCDGLRTSAVSSYVSELGRLAVLLLEDLFPEVPLTDPNVGLGKTSQPGFQLNDGAPQSNNSSSHDPFRVEGPGSPLRAYSLPTRQSTAAAGRDSNDGGSTSGESGRRTLSGQNRSSQSSNLETPSSSGRRARDGSLEPPAKQMLCDSCKQNADSLAIPGPSRIARQEILQTCPHFEPDGDTSSAHRDTSAATDHEDHNCASCAHNLKETCKRRRHSVGCQVTYVHCRCKFIDEDDSDEEEDAHRSRHECDAAPPSGSSETKMCDKATTTNDPLLPKDPLQAFSLSSNSLVSVTINACGISDLNISNTPSLTHLEVLNCRILKRITLKGCPRLERIAVIECLNFNTKSLVSELLALQLTSPCIAYLHPYVPKVRGDKLDRSKEFNAKEILQTVFDRWVKSHHTCVLLDYCLPRSAWDDRGAYREAFLAWMKHMSDVNKILCEECFMQSSGRREVAIEWPVTKIKGLMPILGDYKLYSDNPLFRRLWSRHTQNDIGLPTLESCSCTDKQNCVSILRDDTRKWKESGRRLLQNHVGFYVYVPSAHEGIMDLL